jgi:hypothetical protein
MVQTFTKGNTISDKKELNQIILHQRFSLTIVLKSSKLIIIEKSKCRSGIPQAVNNTDL